MIISKLLCLTGILLAALPAFAEELAVSDCSGVIRAASVVEAGGLSRIVATIKAENSDSPGLVRVSLTDSGNGSTRTSSVADGMAVFSQVPAGRWKICDPQGTAQVEQVSIITAAPSGVYTSEVVLGGAGVAGLAGAVGLSLGGGSSGGDSTLLSGSPGGSIPIEAQGSASQPQVAAAISSQEADRREACLTGEKPEPLSPFL